MMHQTANGVYILFENVESYGYEEIRSLMGDLFGLFLESNYLNVTNGFVRFSYTGVFADATNVFCVLPKYQKNLIVSESDYLTRARELIKILKAYENICDVTTRATDFVNFSSSSVNSEISTADLLLTDYQNNGLWTVLNTKIILGSENEILWDYTIENTFPIVSKYPYYFDQYCNENEYLTNTIITNIHLWALTYCDHKYSDLLDFNLDINSSFGLALEEIGEKSYLISVLERELQKTFNDRDIVLLKALLDLVISSNQYGEDNYTLYGKNKFEHVWEAAVGLCFSNQYYSLKRYLSSPVWSNEIGHINSNHRTVKPDVIRWLDLSDKSLFLIIDAKYYLFSFNELNNSAEGVPGVGDVLKQYFYEFILSRPGSGADWLDRDTKYFNILVFPSIKVSSDNYYIDGTVSIDNIATNRKIKNLFLDADFVFERFYNNKPFDTNLVLEMLTHLDM